MEIDNVVLDGNTLAFFYTHGDLSCEDHKIFRSFLHSEKSRLVLGVANDLRNCSKLLFSIVTVCNRSRKGLRDPQRTP